ncbi:ankyrin repeat-containing domain protein [Ochromonadaceae sp. CCMP2298]|nr:ankyrin repeat-containing domain protein [Ochromonadaceae sp. CCMP2298]
MLLVRGANISDVARVLVNRGAPIAALSGFLDKNPLHLAVENGHYEVADILVKSGHNVVGYLDSTGNHINGATALHLCAQLNQLEIMRLLLESGADREKLGRFSTNGTALHVACEYGNAHAAHLLLTRGSLLEGRDGSAHTALHVACRSGWFDCAFMLIDLDAEVGCRADNARTPLDYVKVATVREKLLLAASAAEERRRLVREEAEAARRAEQEEARRVAAAAEVLRLQEEEVARVAAERTALFVTRLRGHSEVVHGLLRWPGVRIDLQEDNGNTALHNAALRGHREVVEVRVF